MTTQLLAPSAARSSSFSKSSICYESLLPVWSNLMPTDGRRYGSLLYHGLTTAVFWHGDELYPDDMVLSVAQLMELNALLDSESTGNSMDAARRIFQRYPQGPVTIRSKFYRTAKGFPNTENRPDSVDSDKIGEAARQILFTEVDYASGTEIARFFNLVEFDAQVHRIFTGDRKDYILKDFELYKIFFRILFGFSYQEIYAPDPIISPAESFNVMASGVIGVALRRAAAESPTDRMDWV
ncbi:hypothetical protein C8J56DRAFT_367605 [Mycena floridula]|nr:hypothetical protein C8J56DRAFT_367605 [Mycena floridula]